MYTLPDNNGNHDSRHIHDTSVIDTSASVNFSLLICLCYIFIKGIIQDLCSNWNVTDHENYALQFCEPNNKNYVTEKNRSEVKNGSVLRLRYSPSKTANDILETLRTGTDPAKTTVLENLSVLSSDITFALEFIKEQGLNLIIDMIDDETCVGGMLKYVLLSFVELMEHGTVSWDILESSFINRTMGFINNPDNEIKEVVESALSILENIVQNSSKCTLIDNVKLENLLKLLQDSSTQVIQQNTIALINALFMKASMKADTSKCRSIANTFSSKQYRSVLLSSINSTNIGTEMAHQLYVLQTLTMGLLKYRMLTKMNTQDQDAHEKIKELRRIAFDDGTECQSDVTARRQNNAFSNYYKKLGFKCDINPAQDFIETPPGMLALDCMVYFARNYQVFLLVQ